MLEMNRRSLITGLVSLIAAPAIVRAGSLMPVKLYDLAPSELIDEIDQPIRVLKTFRIIIQPSAGTKAHMVQLVEDLDKKQWCPLDSVKPPCD